MIVQLNLQNVEEIFRLEQECFELPWKKELIESHLENHHAFGFMEDGAIAGYVLFMESDCVEILRIGVARNHRRKGIARQLVEDLKDFQKDIILEVSSANSDAIAFYTGAGFVETGRREHYYSDGSDAVLMDLPFGE